MALRDRRPAAGPVVVAFAAVAAASTLVLGILAWQLVAQDRLLDEPRRRGLQEAAADEAVRAMEAWLADLRSVLDREPDTDRLTPPLPDGVSRLTIASSGTTTADEPRLPFVPVRAPLPEAAHTVFAEADAAELQRDDRQGARTAYIELAGYADTAVRAGALARLAPLQQKLGEVEEALATYDKLAALGGTAVGGLPAELVASVGRAKALAAWGDAPALEKAAASLAGHLADGRWPLLQSEFESYANLARAWGGTPPVADLDDRIARADAATWLWSQRDRLPPNGQRLLARTPGAVLLLWHAAGDRLEVIAAGPAALSAVLDASVPTGFVGTVRDLEGRRALGVEESSGPVVPRLASPDGLPWTLELQPDPATISTGGEWRRQLVMLTVGATVLMVGGGWYFIARALARERRAARLQSEFVSSVSHEFRSPLTSLAHAADLLATDRLGSDQQRRRVYDALVGDTARLRELVEHLLDFGRFDSGTLTLNRERVDVRTWLASVVEDARHRVRRDGYSIEYGPADAPLVADIDRTALGRAVWNLIDNAVKYSPGCQTIRVDAFREGDRIAIAVHDQGLGIPATEQDAVFQRFVRGSAAQAGRIQGTGIGLALVRQIVQAHAGEVTVASEPGRGSTFTIRVPGLEATDVEDSRRSEPSAHAGTRPDLTVRPSDMES